MPKHVLRNQWAFYQTRGIKAAVLAVKTTLGGSMAEGDREKLAKYAQEQAEIQGEAKQQQAEAKADFHQHEVFPRAVTLFQIAIAIAAIAALTRRRRYWIFSRLIGATGCVFLVLGFIAR